MSEPLTMPWGKYRGNNIEDIPSDYLEWLLTATDFDIKYPKLAEEAGNQLRARGGEGIKR